MACEQFWWTRSLCVCLCFLRLCLSLFLSVQHVGVCKTGVYSKSRLLHWVLHQLRQPGFPLQISNGFLHKVYGKSTNILQKRIAIMTHVQAHWAPMLRGTRVGWCILFIWLNIMVYRWKWLQFWKRSLIKKNISSECLRCLGNIE